MKIQSYKNHPFSLSCQISHLVAQAKEKVEAELTADLPQLPEHLLHLSLNEAEAIAWTTGYPQLIFPVLAEEKAIALLNWNIRQSFLRAGAEPDLVA